jgi:hypothetical protein
MNDIGVESDLSISLLLNLILDFFFYKSVVLVVVEFLHKLV